MEYYIKKNEVSGYLHTHRCMHARNYRMYSKQDSKDSPLAEYDPLDLKHFVIKTETSDEPSSGFMLVLTPVQKPRPPPPLRSLCLGLITHLESQMR